MEQHKYQVGIERESLRCTKNGKLSTLPHPQLLEDKNHLITTDWCEAQIEIRTQPCSSTLECYSKLEELTNLVLNKLKQREELLWPYSMPCILPNNDEFMFVNNTEKEYKKYLLTKYSNKMLCMSGIHVNFSISQEFYTEIKQLNNKLPDNIDTAYLKIMQNFTKKAWILIYLFGATPLQNGKDSYKCEHSIRNSYKEGYKNDNLLDIGFENKKDYIKSIEENIKVGNIDSARELYTPIRAKGLDKNDLEYLRNHQINHIEVRICDLNPFDKCAISKEQLDFTIAFLFNCLVDDNTYVADYREIAEKGISKEQSIKISQEFENILKINQEFNLNFQNSIKTIYTQFSSGLTESKKIKTIIEEKGYIEGILQLANKYINDVK